jgi:protein-tyrosine phosphatase
VAIKILMVCLGNICRSPLAEGILRAKAMEHNIQLIVDSAGTSAYHAGGPPDKRSVAVAKAHGLDIQHQISRQFSVQDFDTFDFIYVMDDSNYEDILSLARSQKDRQKVSLILDKTAPGKHNNVPDPYYGGKDGFENMYQLLDTACDAIVAELKKG